MIQEIDGAWTLARNAARLLPSGVRTLIQRRAARLPDETKDEPRRRRHPRSELQSQGSSLDQAAPRGRRGRLQPDGARRVAGARRSVRDYSWSTLAGSPADYSFTHDQIREFAAAMLTAARRRAIHSGDRRHAESPTAIRLAESMSLLAHHALAGDDPERAVRFSISAARAALECPGGGGGAARRRPGAASRLGSAAIALRCSLPRTTPWACFVARPTGSRASPSSPHWRRRSATPTSSSTSSCVGLPHCVCPRTRTQAAELALSVREAAQERGDRAAELAACLELGQDLLQQSPLGESFSAPSEVDLDGAAEAYRSVLANSQRSWGTMPLSRPRCANSESSPSPGCESGTWSASRPAKSSRSWRGSPPATRPPRSSPTRR